MFVFRMLSIDGGEYCAVLKIFSLHSYVYLVASRTNPRKAPGRIRHGKQFAIARRGAVTHPATIMLECFKCVRYHGQLSSEYLSPESALIASESGRSAFPEPVATSRVSSFHAYYVLIANCNVLRAQEVRCALSNSMNLPNAYPRE